MVKILFVCHGNICRSPMAEFVMKDMVKNNPEVYIESCATSREEIGNPVYPPAKRKLSENGIDCTGKTARQITKADYDNFDYIILMDRNNKRNIGYIIDGDPHGKISLLMDWCGENRDVADPWYTGDFDATYRDVLKGCTAIKNKLKL